MNIRVRENDLPVLYYHYDSLSTVHIDISTASK